MTFHDLAGGVERQQFIGNVFDSLLGLALDAFPFGGAQPVDVGLMLAHAHVAAQAVRLVDRHVQLVTGGILHQQVLPVPATERHLDQPLEQAYPMLYVDDVRSRLHVGEKGLGSNGTGPPCPAWDGPRPAKHLGIGQQRAFGRQRPSFGQCPLDQRQAVRRRGLAYFLHGNGGDRSLLQQLGDALSLAADDDHPLTGLSHLLKTVQHPLELAAVAFAMDKGLANRAGLWLLVDTAPP